MATIEEKQTILVDGLDKLESKLHRELYKHLSKGDYDGYDLAVRNYKYCGELVGNLWKGAQQLNDARFKRVQRIRKRIEALILSGDALFVTLNFKDETLLNTTASTRRQIVYRYLKAVSSVYVANIDYGEDKGREHYHAVCGASRIDYALWHQYGGIKALFIRKGELDATRVAKYVAKLTNHAIKHTTHNARIIYSRKTV